VGCGSLKVIAPVNSAAATPRHEMPPAREDWPALSRLLELTMQLLAAFG